MNPPFDAARQLVDDYEHGLDPQDRRRRGVHHTPPELARALVEVGIDALGRLPRRVVDPSCGGGAFLLAAADALVDRGASPLDVVSGMLFGAELDPDGARVTQDAFERWAEAHGVPARRVDVPVVVGDALLRSVSEWNEVFPGKADLVIGNPPFLSQLSASTARSPQERDAVRQRFGLRGRYADASALFLLVGCDLAADDGAVVMLQPRSMLAVRDAAGVREKLLARSTLMSVWSTDVQWFDAAVAVCAPVLRLGAGSEAHSRTNSGGINGGDVQVLRDIPVRCGGSVPAMSGESWGPVLAGVHGIPSVQLPAGPTLASIAQATAGFRDEFYALCSVAEDCAGTSINVGPAIATVGMIDVARNSWGQVPAKLGGKKMREPRANLARLAEQSPGVARWVDSRLVPKVLLATQTKVVEAAVDSVGDIIPLTPLISVEPQDHADVWRVAAVLTAPPVSAAAVANNLGSGRSLTTLRWSASGVLATPLPANRSLWNEGAALVEELHRQPVSRRSLLEKLGRTMVAAYGEDPTATQCNELISWWIERADRS